MRIASREDITRVPLLTFCLTQNEPVTDQCANCNHWDQAPTLLAAMDATTRIPELEDAQYCTDVMRLSVSKTELQYDRELLKGLMVLESWLLCPPLPRLNASRQVLLIQPSLPRESTPFLPFQTLLPHTSRLIRLFMAALVSIIHPSTATSINLMAESSTLLSTKTTFLRSRPSTRSPGPGSRFPLPEALGRAYLVSARERAYPV